MKNIILVLASIFVLNGCSQMTSNPYYQQAGILLGVGLVVYGTAKAIDYVADTNTTGALFEPQEPNDTSNMEQAFNKVTMENK